MTIWTVRCAECEETRTARKRDGELRPYRETCPSCGTAEFENVVDDD